MSLSLLRPNPTDASTTPGPSWRLPAADLEATVVRCLTAFLGNAAALDNAASKARVPDAALADFIVKASTAARTIKDDPTASCDLLHRVDVHDDRVEVTICLEALMPASTTEAGPTLHCLSVPVARIRRGKDVRMIIGDGTPSPTRADPALLKLIATARAAWLAMVASGETPLAEVAKSQGYLPEHFTLLLRLSTLAPSIVAAIVEGRQPVTLTRQRLATISKLPSDWAEQRVVLGFE